MWAEEPPAPDLRYSRREVYRRTVPPLLFPDTFYEGNDPVPEAVENWLCARRALMRKPVDRIGYGGYLSLAYKFPALWIILKR